MEEPESPNKSPDKNAEQHQSVNEGDPVQNSNVHNQDGQSEYEDIPEDEYQELVKTMEDKKAKDEE